MGSATLIITGHPSLIPRDIGASFAAASLMTGVVSIAGGVTRPVFGRLADLYGGDALKNILTACSVLGSVAVLVGYVTGSLPVLALGYVLAGAANGGNAVYICDFVQDRYGSARYGMNMAVTNLYMIAGSLLARRWPEPSKPKPAAAPLPLWLCRHSRRSVCCLACFWGALAAKRSIKKRRIHHDDR